MTIPGSKHNHCPASTGWAQTSFFCGEDGASHTYFGFHTEGDRATFRLWAPRADEVFLCGDFNGWSVTATPMQPLEGGVWEVTLPASAVQAGQTYKYFLRRGEGGAFKADPYGTQMQRPPESASVIPTSEAYPWRDGGWMAYRKGRFSRSAAKKQPVNIYEVHLGSWQRREDGTPCTYGEIAAELIPYVKQMGYTHVELMPIAEHHEDGSLGYEVSGFFAPTARYGSPTELKRLIDGLHEAGIGVILDWTPAHFGVEAHGLCNFDGEPLYEYSDPKKTVTPWGSRRFDLGRGEVRSFLLSNAMYWIGEFHADGLRVSSADAMLFPSGEGDGDPVAIDFLRELNRRLEAEYPDVMTFAESVLGADFVTDGVPRGLGFTLFWDAPQIRQGLCSLATGSLAWDCSQGFGAGAGLLPLSHDEEPEAPGDARQRLARLRGFLTCFMTRPGKKLFFMGNELGGGEDWRFFAPLPWHLGDREPNARYQLFVAELNALYLRCPALWRMDGEGDGVMLLRQGEDESNVYSYLRRDGGGEELVILLHLSPERQNGYLLPVPQDGVYEEIFNSDLYKYGGTGAINPDPLRSQNQVLSLTLPPLGALILKKRR